MLTQSLLSGIFRAFFIRQHTKVFLISNEDNNFLFDLKKLKLLLQNNPSLVYFCSPSNPQGKIASYEYIFELIKIVRFYNSVLIVDECYIDIFYEKVPWCTWGLL